MPRPAGRGWKMLAGEVSITCYNYMSYKRGSHCIYDTNYHLVWSPKYRKWILQGEIREHVKELFREISEHHGFEIDELGVAKDHVHIFLSFPPKYSILKVVGLLKQ